MQLEQEADRGTNRKGVTGVKSESPVWGRGIAVICRKQTTPNLGACLSHGFADPLGLAGQFSYCSHVIAV